MAKVAQNKWYPYGCKNQQLFVHLLDVLNACQDYGAARAKPAALEQETMMLQENIKWINKQEYLVSTCICPFICSFKNIRLSFYNVFLDHLNVVQLRLMNMNFYGKKWKMSKIIIKIRNLTV